MTVIVLERGDFSGSKNVTGGRIYLSPLRPYLPDLWKEAPLERHVTKEFITLLGEANSTTFEIYSDRFNREPYPSYIILRRNSTAGSLTSFREKEFRHPSKCE
jgi:electron transfer flavoprotein-quinone oxidoreductase